MVGALPQLTHRYMVRRVSDGHRWTRGRSVFEFQGMVGMPPQLTSRLKAVGGLDRLTMACGEGGLWWRVAGSVSVGSDPGTRDEAAASDFVVWVAEVGGAARRLGTAWHGGKRQASRYGG